MATAQQLVTEVRAEESRASRHQAGRHLVNILSPLDWYAATVCLQGNSSALVVGIARPAGAGPRGSADAQRHADRLGAHAVGRARHDADPVAAAPQRPGAD